MERAWRKMEIRKIPKTISDSKKVEQGAAVICGSPVFLHNSPVSREKFVCRSLIVHEFQAVLG